jgi:hypothetical protein
MACSGTASPLQDYRVTSLALSKEYELRVFEKRVQRRIPGPKRQEETGRRRELHSEELNNLYSSQNIIKVIKSG